MARGLDHIAHAVRDLDAAADLYRRLGFTVGARNRHSWGTHNHVVQLPGFFIELVTMAEPEKVGTDGFSVLFARFNQSFLERHEGLSMLLLEGKDAASDAAAFKAAGIAASDKLTFEREAKRPDGSPVKVGFSLAFARDEQTPEVAFATCQQHYPENFWNPAFQEHANGVSAIVGAVLVAEDPADHQAFLSAFTGVQDLRVSSGTVAAQTPRGMVAIVSEAAFRDRFGTEPPVIARGMRLAAMQFTVRDATALRRVLAASKIRHSAHMGAIVVPPKAAMGATLAFEPIG